MFKRLFGITRYFIVFYEGTSKRGLLWVASKNGSYAKADFIIKFLLEKYNEHCTITNVIELSKRDYEDFIKD